MADLNITISTRFGIYGGGLTSKWNEQTWNAFNWGEGTIDLMVNDAHILGSTFTLSSSVIKYVQHLIEESATLTDAVSKNVTVNVDTLTAVDVSLAGDASSQYLRDGNGYYYNFPDRVTDAEDRNISTYTSGTTATSGWAAVSDTDTSWSEQ